MSDCSCGGDHQGLTAGHAADVLGKASTSAAVEHVLSQPDPWGALHDRLEWQNELQYERQPDREAGS